MYGEGNTPKWSEIVGYVQETVISLVLGVYDQSDCIAP